MLDRSTTQASASATANDEDRSTSEPVVRQEIKAQHPRCQRTFLWKSLQIIARVLTTLLFDLKVYGRHHIPARGGVLIVSNHQGNLDPVLLAVRLYRPLNYIAKSELFESRWSGWLLRRALNAVPVRVGAGDISAVRETIQRLREGHLMNMYPEGARTLDGNIGPLQMGVALIVRRAKIPVIPAVIVGSFQAWPIQYSFLRPWPIRVRYGPAMELAGLTPDEIVATIDRTLRTMFEDLRRHAR
jgi:1-acyl-sn-glycerol-3-phosphate acyltransferase